MVKWGVSPMSDILRHSLDLVGRRGVNRELISKWNDMRKTLTTHGHCRGCLPNNIRLVCGVCVVVYVVMCACVCMCLCAFQQKRIAQNTHAEEAHPNTSKKYNQTNKHTTFFPVLSAIARTQQ